MAKYLEFDPEQIGVGGLIPLRRGDDWRILAALTNSGKFPVNLTGVAIAVHFPQDITLTDGSDYVADAQILDVESNQIVITVPDTATTGIALSQPGGDGLGIFAIMTDAMGKQTTFENAFPILEVKDRDFNNNT